MTKKGSRKAKTEPKQPTRSKRQRPQVRAPQGEDKTQLVQEGKVLHEGGPLATQPSTPPAVPMADLDWGDFDSDQAVPGLGIDEVATTRFETGASWRTRQTNATTKAPSRPSLIEEEIGALEERLRALRAEQAHNGVALGVSDGAQVEPPVVSSDLDNTATEAETGATLAPTQADIGATKELFSTGFYLRQWGRIGLRRRVEDVDEFGFDAQLEARKLALIDFLARRYFRIETEGVERIPDNGRCLLVANHSGATIPLDGLMLRAMVRLNHPKRVDVRWLSEDFVHYFPFVGTTYNRLGAVRACQENAERLLQADKALAVFPEGMKGLGKLFRERYRLQRFGRGGFIRLCLRTRTPIVPVAIVGAEESSPLIYRLDAVAKAFGLPYVPVTPTFPLLGPMGLLPAPTKWRVHFGESVSFHDAYGPDAANDDFLVGRLTERVRATIQAMLNDMVKQRKSVWFG